MPRFARLLRKQRANRAVVGQLAVDQRVVAELHDGLGSGGELDAPDVALLPGQRTDAQHDHPDRHAPEDVPLAHPVDLGDADELEHAHVGLDQAAVQQELEDPARHDQRGEHADHDAQAEGDREALDLFRGDPAENRTGDQRGQVGVEDGAERPLVGGLEGHPDRLVLGLLFAQALEDQHVGVDGDADGQDDARDARQREDRLQEAHGPKHEDDVQHERGVRDGAGEQVVDQHEHGDGDQARISGPLAHLAVFPPDARAERALGDGGLVQPRRQRTGLQRPDEVVDLFLGEVALDDAPLGDCRLDHGRGVDFVVQQDGHAMPGASIGGAVLGRQPGELLRPPLVEAEAYRGLVPIVAVGLGARELPAARAALLQHHVARDVVQQHVPFAGVVGRHEPPVTALVSLQGEPQQALVAFAHPFGTFAMQHRRQANHLVLGNGELTLDARGVRRDAELQHARLGNEALQVGGIVQVAADFRPGHVLVGDVIDLRRARRVLLPQLPQPLVAPLLPGDHFLPTALAALLQGVLFRGRHVVAQNPQKLLRLDVPPQQGVLDPLVSVHRLIVGVLGHGPLLVGRRGANGFLGRHHCIVGRAQRAQQLGEFRVAAGQFRNRRLPCRAGRLRDAAGVRAADIAFVNRPQRPAVRLPGVARFLLARGHADHDPVVAQGPPLRVGQAQRVHAVSQDADHVLGESAPGPLLGHVRQVLFDPSDVAGEALLLLVRRGGRQVRLGGAPGLLEAGDLGLVADNLENQAVPAAEVDALAQPLVPQGAHRQQDQQSQKQKLQR